MFEIGCWYENKLGKYQVLAVNGDVMTVRYEDGHQQNLSVVTQTRIQESRQLQVASSVALHRGRTYRSYRWVDGRAYLTMGFLSVRMAHLGANLTVDKEASYRDEYQMVKGTDLQPDQDGVSFLREGANQWGNQGVIRFHASDSELSLLSFSRKGNTPYPVSGAEGQWEVKDIAYHFFLLGHGFELGSVQSRDVIISKILLAQKALFNKGVEYGLRA